jgi:hypothetical protein
MPKVLHRLLYPASRSPSKASIDSVSFRAIFGGMSDIRQHILNIAEVQG